jgi:hypothetical protein
MRLLEPETLTADDVPVGGPWLHRIFVLRQLLEARVDAALAGPWPAGGRIVFYNEVDAGLGDVAFMTKLLRRLAPEALGTELTLVTTGLDKQRRFTLPPGVVVIPIEDAVGHPAVGPCDLVVSAPGIFDHCRSRSAVLDALGLPAGTPFLYLAEYGSIRQLRDDAFKGHLAAIEVAQDGWVETLARAHGVDPDDTGFHPRTGAVVHVGEVGKRVIGDLGARFFDPESPENPLAGWMGSGRLEARSCGLEAGELGLHIEGDLVAEASVVPRAPESHARRLGHPVVAARVQEALAAGTAIYQGYAHSGHVLFHDMLSARERDTGRDVLAVIPDARGAGRILSEDFPEPLRAHLARRGFGGVRVTGRRDDDPGELATVEATWGEGRRWEVLSAYPLSHADMLRLMLLSEAPTMVSGDQSFSDAVSARKAIWLVEPVYCQTWHLDAVCRLAAEISPRLEALLQVGLRFAWRPEALSGLEEGLATEGQALVRDAVALSDRVIADHAAGGPVLAALGRAFRLARGDAGLAARSERLVAHGLAALRGGRLPSAAGLDAID